MREVSETWRFRWSCNKPLPGWRPRLAMWLRKAAGRLDGRYSLAIAIETQPPITCAQQRECIKHGLEAMDRAIKTEAIEAARENAYRKVWPALYEEA